MMCSYAFDIHGHAHRCKQVYHAGAQGSFLHWALMWLSWQDSQSIAAAMTRWVVFKKFSIVFSLFLMVSHGLFWGIPDSLHENKIERLVRSVHREYRDQSRSVSADRISAHQSCHATAMFIASPRGTVHPVARLRSGLSSDWMTFLLLDVSVCKICKWM